MIANDLDTKENKENIVDKILNSIQIGKCKKKPTQVHTHKLDTNYILITIVISSEFCLFSFCVSTLSHSERPFHKMNK